MRTLGKIQITLLAVVIMVAIPFSAYAVDGKIKIGQIATTTFPIVIDQPGSYVLTSNLTVTAPGFNCIMIDADNITLDLNGFALIGPGTGEGGGNGISANDKRNISIKNGTIRDFLAGAVYLWTATPTNITHHNHQVTDVKVYNNGGGITAYGATITNCVSADTAGDGMKVTNCTVKDCTVNNNGGGIESEGSTIINCTINNNGANGIHATDSTVVNCTANNNGDKGIDVTGCTVTNCTSSSNNAGILAYDSCITNCTIKQNNFNGISLATNNIVTNCSVSYNNGSGIYISLTGNRVEGNNLRFNGYDGSGYGIYISGSGEKNYIIKNTTSDNGTSNILDQGSNDYAPICVVDPTDNCNYSF